MTSYQVLGYQFAIATRLTRADQVLARLLEPFAAQASPSEQPTYRLFRAPERRAFYRAERDDQLLVEARVLGPLFDHVLWDINQNAVSGCGALAVHAAAASLSNSAVLLPAPPDSGKTTLVAALVADGWNYLTDEASLINRECGVEPYPKPLSLAPEALRLLPRVESRVTDLDLMPATVHISAEQIRPGAFGAAAPIRTIVFPRYAAGARTKLVSLRRAEALAELIDNVFDRDHLDRARIELLGSLVSDASCYRLTMGDVAGAVAAVRQAMDGTTRRAP